MAGGVFLLLCCVAVWVLIPSTRARRQADRTRQTLRALGFKLDLKEFALSSSPDQRSRADTLLHAGHLCSGIVPMGLLDLLPPTATNAGIVLHAQDKFPAGAAIDWWPTLAASMDAAGLTLDETCATIASGRFRFEPSTGSGGEFVILYLTDLRSLAVTLAARTILELHRSNHDAAFTNLLALTRLATQWDVEPVEQAHYFRFFLVDMAQRSLWQSLHSPGWTDAELLLLKNEWQQPEFFSGLPEAIACTRAVVLEQQARETLQPTGPPLSTRQILSEFFNSPAGAWNQIHGRIADSRFRNYGVYEEESQAMLFYRDREVELRNAIQAGSWSQMRALAGITNIPGFNQGTGAKAGIRFAPRGFGYRQGQTLPRRAAESEAARRLAVTAIALERFRLARGNYPRSLDELVPAFLAKVPLDFMDGRPLRYRPQPNTDFVLYSTGLDCLDDGGMMFRTEPQSGQYGAGFFGRPGRREGPDMLWPRAASTAETEAELARLASLAGQPPAPKVIYPR